MYTYDTLSEAVTDLTRRGYTENFNLQPDCLACAALSLQLHPEEFTIDEYYRFEGASNPDDNSIVYAISSDNGVKGVLTDAYGIYSESLSPAMIAKLRVSHEA